MAGRVNHGLASPCGLYCGECLYFKEQCQGCVPSDGHPSWGRCRTYACAVKRNVKHCGECAEFPCDLFLKQYSPELGPWRVFYKAGQLIYRKKIGTTAWVKEKASGKNPDPKATVERHLSWEKEQKKEKNKQVRNSKQTKQQSEFLHPALRTAKMSVKRQKKQSKLIFCSTVFPNKSSETQAALLAESIRAFAGSLAQAPIWLLTPDIENRLSATFKKKSLALNISLIPFKTDNETLSFPLAGNVLAAALAESRAHHKADLLAWLSSNTIVIQEPKDFLLPDDKTLGFRPVHHTLISSRYNESLDPFWTLIYNCCNVPETRIFPMTTHVDGTRIRPHFNAGLLVTRPERHLLQAWRDVFFKVYQEPSFQKLYQMDERYSVFVHQAVLSGVILSTFETDEIQELPSTYNYPLHLHAEDVTDHRPSFLEELVTFRHEGFYADSEWINKIPAKEPLKRWIAEQLSQFTR